MGVHLGAIKEWGIPQKTSCLRPTPSTLGLVGRKPRGSAHLHWGPPWPRCIPFGAKQVNKHGQSPICTAAVSIRKDVKYGKVLFLGLSEIWQNNRSSLSSGNVYPPWFGMFRPTLKRSSASSKSFFTATSQHWTEPLRQESLNCVFVAKCGLELALELVNNLDKATRC